MGGDCFIFLEEEKVRECTRLRLEVEEENTRAAALYRKLGSEVLNYVQMVKDKV